MAQAPETTGNVYGCTHCPAADMNLTQAHNHNRVAHPWAITYVTTRPETFQPVTISVEAFNLPQFAEVVERHARRLGYTPVIEGKPRRTRKRGTITLTTQAHEVPALEAIVAELEAAK